MRGTDEQQNENDGLRRLNGRLAGNDWNNLPAEQVEPSAAATRQVKPITSRRPVGVLDALGCIVNDCPSSVAGRPMITPPLSAAGDCSPGRSRRSSPPVCV